MIMLLVSVVGMVLMRRVLLLVRIAASLGLLLRMVVLQIVSLPVGPVTVRSKGEPFPLGQSGGEVRVGMGIILLLLGLMGAAAVRGPRGRGRIQRAALLVLVLHWGVGRRLIMQTLTAVMGVERGGCGGMRLGEGGRSSGWDSSRGRGGGSNRLR